MKKTLLLILLCVFAAMALTGCGGNADTMPTPTQGVQTSPAASASPGLSPDTSPDTSPGGMVGIPENSAAPTGATQGVTTVEQARASSDSLKEALDKLTEVEDAAVLVTGTTALVGLKLDSQYKGTLDERLNSMMLSRAQSVESAVTQVKATTDEETVKKIKQLYDMLEGATSLTPIIAQADSIAATIK